MNSFYLHGVVKINMATQNCTNATGESYQVLKLELTKENGQLEAINLFSVIGGKLTITNEVLDDVQY